MNKYYCLVQTGYFLIIGYAIPGSFQKTYQLFPVDVYQTQSTKQQICKN